MFPSFFHFIICFFVLRYRHRHLVTILPVTLYNVSSSFFHSAPERIGFISPSALSLLLSYANPYPSAHIAVVDECGGLVLSSLVRRLSFQRRERNKTEEEEEDQKDAATDSKQEEDEEKTQPPTFEPLPNGIYTPAQNEGGGIIASIYRSIRQNTGDRSTPLLCTRDEVCSDSSFCFYFLLFFLFFFIFFSYHYFLYSSLYLSRILISFPPIGMFLCR